MVWILKNIVIFYLYYVISSTKHIKTRSEQLTHTLAVDS